MGELLLMVLMVLLLMVLMVLLLMVLLGVLLVVLVDDDAPWLQKDQMQPFVLDQSTSQTCITTSRHATLYLTISTLFSITSSCTKISSRCFHLVPSNKLSI